MKKVVLGIGIVGIISLMGYTAVTNLPQAEAKSIPKDAICEQPKTITGDPIVIKPNEYCKTTCTPKARTDFPTEKHSVKVDQTVKAGSQFQWEEVRIQTEMECETDIYYEKWYNDYHDTIRKMEEALANIAREAHQYHTEEVMGDCTIRDYYGGLEKVSASVYSSYKSSYNSYLNNLRKWEGAGSILNKELGAVRIKYTEPRNGCLLRDCKSKGAGDSCTDGRYQIDNYQCCRYLKGNQYVSPDQCTIPEKYEVQKFNSRKGTLYRYTRVQCGDTANTCGPVGERTYCDRAKPTWDNINYDNYWTDVYNGLKRTLESMGGNGLPGKLVKCNDNGFNQIFKTYKDPQVVVHYNDPTGVYKDAENLKLNMSIVEGPTYTEDREKTVYAPDHIRNVDTFVTQVDGVGNLTLSAVKGIPWNWGRITTRTSKTNGAYSQYAKTKIVGKIITKYKYDMPKGFYQYTIKPEGTAVHADDIPSSKLESGQYIDIGYSNYPVHYQTPTSTYPISLTYNIPMVSTGNRLYECRYKVKNKIACPEGECPEEEEDKIPPCTGDCCEGDCDPGELYKGLNLIYRPVDLSEPFHYKNGKVRASGENWETEDVEKYIKTNRGVEDDDVYKQKPIYDFTLTPSAISDIRSYNRSHELSDFRMTCRGKDRNGKTIGTRCSSDFLREYNGKLSASGSCVNASKSNFYRCAGKEVDQDIIAVEKAIEGK